MTSIPAWIIAFQTFLAIVVAAVAVAQWWTSHNRLVLDLFEKRAAVFNDVGVFLRYVMKSPHNLETKEILDFHAVRSRAQHLFGNDVQQALKRFHGLIIDMHSFDDSVTGRERDERAAYRVRALENFAEAMKLADDFPALFEPYLAMRQKRLRSLREWFEHRNSLRKSYADQSDHV